ncbi:SDR family NAD(P)-dependent oxidoreductase [Bradyrhizobium erythrophlei]|uniref:NAD(P)-dependent dehydrogenase, short-chain alcohol dehydrogenase family n=1 Tax=Bradyrhizobium erythrophlei TaxID=1437360 RepID=A0A1H5GA24_9BRAD|nr:SDR family NAD(P)-dependent oxidoreductase [Bradyrhizobium erythrophlei]SEE12563.1 NAD(P)-dependent dehydrogenase, short-chain alcohol dehydrogenase family [Bradyrhizobium erythrophlei]
MMKADELFDVRNNIVAITGAASGIGLAIAEILAANRARLALFDIDQAALAIASNALAKTGAEVFAKAIDLRDRLALRDAFDTVVDHYGGLDTVFANAGIGAGPGFVGLDGTRYPSGALEMISDNHWDDVIAVNLSGVFATIQAAARHMKPRRMGRIIVTTSIASSRNQSWIGTPYMPAKAGAAHLVRQAALELAEFNITVNAIAPGAFATNIGGGRLKIAEVAATVSRGIPLGILRSYGCSLVRHVR